MFTDSLARKTRSTLDFLINQSRRALKRYNVILAMERERRTTAGRERGKGKRVARRITRLHLYVRALTSSLETIRKHRKHSSNLKRWLTNIGSQSDEATFGVHTPWAMRMRYRRMGYKVMTTRENINNSYSLKRCTWVDISSQCDNCKLSDCKNERGHFLSPYLINQYWHTERKI